MSYTLTTSAAILYEAGSNHPLATHANSGAMLAKFSDQAEGAINSLTHFDWVANYSSIGANFKPILDDAAASYAAIKVIKFDMSGYTNQSEAFNMLNVLTNNFNNAINTLKLSATRQLMGGT